MATSSPTAASIRLQIWCRPCNQFVTVEALQQHMYSEQHVRRFSEQRIMTAGFLQCIDCRMGFNDVQQTLQHFSTVHPTHNNTPPQAAPRIELPAGTSEVLRAMLGSSAINQENWDFIEDPGQRWGAEGGLDQYLSRELDQNSGAGETTVVGQQGGEGALAHEMRRMMLQDAAASERARAPGRAMREEQIDENYSDDEEKMALD